MASGCVETLTPKGVWIHFSGDLVGGGGGEDGLVSAVLTRRHVRLSETADPPEAPNAVVPGEVFREALKRLHNSRAGPSLFDAVMMFKIPFTDMQQPIARGLV